MIQDGQCSRALKKRQKSCDGISYFKSISCDDGPSSSSLLDDSSSSQDSPPSSASPTKSLPLPTQLGLDNEPIPSSSFQAVTNNSQIDVSDEQHQLQLQSSIHASLEEAFLKVDKILQTRVHLEDVTECRVHVEGNISNEALAVQCTATLGAGPVPNQFEDNLRTFLKKGCEAGPSTSAESNNGGC